MTRFISLKNDAEANDDQLVAEKAADLPPTLLSVIGGIYVLSMDAVDITTLPTAIRFDGGDVPGPLLAMRRGVRLLIAGRAPYFPQRQGGIRTVSLLSSRQQERLHSFDPPLRIQSGDAGVTGLLGLLDGPDRGAIFTFFLRVISSLAGTLDAALAQLVHKMVHSRASTRNAWVHVLDRQHLYWRVALPEGSGPPGAVAVRCFLLRDQHLIQISCGKALRTASNSLHMLSRVPASGASGSLIVVVGSIVVSASVRPAPRNVSLSALEAILGGQADEPQTVKRFLLSRCTELYRSHRTAEVLALGNHIWAQTPFSSRAVVRPELEFGVSIDCILPVPGKGLLIIGWLLDPHRLLDHLDVVDGQGRSGRMRAPLFRYPRPDVRKALPGHGCASAGFVSFHPIAGTSELWPTYQVKGMLKSGATLDLATDLKASRGWLSSAEHLLGLVPPATARQELYQQLMPVVSYLQARRSARIKTRRIYQFLGAVEAPVITVVVPIYKRLDHARHQLAHFAADPAFAQIELIYVLDAPEFEGAFAAQLDAWCHLYQRPARLAVMQRNAGFAGATNAGARLGRGRFLVLLNSDIIPAAAGWAHAMQQVLEADEAIGAVGAHLLYEDGAVQHAGIDHVRDSSGCWKVVHPGKGLRASVPSRAVAAVTAACMMIRADLYKSLGGLSADYVMGDFDDSDLCLRIRKTGKSIWFCADAVLYHLERQSIGTDARYTPTIRGYNQALHQHRWADILAEGLN